MMQLNMKFWYKYKMGDIKRKLTKKEQEEVDNCDFAMDLLIPTEVALEKMKQLQSVGFKEHVIVDIMAVSFKVPAIVMYIKYNELKNILDNEYANNNMAR